MSGASEKDWGNSKMISIAICDDEAVFAEALHALVDAGMKEILYGENSMDERELSYEITVFTNPLMMIDALKTKRFDLAFCGCKGTINILIEQEKTKYFLLLNVY